VILWVNARLWLMCDECHRRWPAPPDTEDGRHLCDVCRGAPVNA
jgi:hypothetical protein